MRAIPNQASRTKLSLVLACFAIFAVACGDDDGPGTDAGGGFDAGPRDASAPMCSTTGEENTVAACTDECDNDGDEHADCEDRDCCGVRTDCPATTFCGRQDAGTPVMECETEGPENTIEACSNECDDDRNGFVDCNDFACCGVRTDCPLDTECGAANVTIAQLQNPDDPMHPDVGTQVTVDQAGMIALTPRLLVGSASGGSSRTCNFAIWVGAPVSGEFTAIQVRETSSLPDGTSSCFALPPGAISPDFAPGDAVTAITTARYEEFCAGPSGSSGDCANFQQSNLRLLGRSRLIRGDAGTAPAATVVEVADLVGASGAPGARALALEGGLLRVEGVRITSRTEMPNPSTTITTYEAADPAAPDVKLDIQVTNFPATTCVRNHFNTLAEGTDTTSVSGILVPNFGRWTLRIRDEADVDGLTCD